MSAHVLFDLSYEFEESDKMRGEASVLSLFRNEIINSILFTRARCHILFIIITLPLKRYNFITMFATLL